MPEPEAVNANGANIGNVITSSTTARVTEIPHVNESIRIDGILDEALWRKAAVFELTLETNPGENIPASVRTLAYVMENGSHVLVGFKAFDPYPEKIRANFRDRDSAFSDDFVLVGFDSFNDQRQSYEFAVNPLGVQMDMLYDELSGNENSAWDAIWEAAGQITEEGYVVEIAVPFSQFRFPEQEGKQRWRIDLVRIHPRKDRNRISLVPKERGNNCYLCQLTEVEGFAAAKPGKNFEIVPTLTTHLHQRRETLADDLESKDPEADAGLTVRWGITEDMTASLTYNPDFSHVESDTAQLDVNNRFALFYPERRPFFLEGAEYFNSPINIVFTRNIADPEFGVKLTGRKNANTYAIFLADDNVTNLIFPGTLGSGSTSLAQSALSLVGRYQRELADGYTAGALYTERRGDEYYNRVGGLDGKFRLNDNHTLRWQFLNSDTEYPDSAEQDDAKISGSLTYIGYNYNSRNWFTNLNYRNFRDDFRADMGFVTQVGYEQGDYSFGHTWQGDDDNWWNNIEVWNFGAYKQDQQGRSIEHRQQVFASINGPLQSYMRLGVGDLDSAVACYSDSDAAHCGQASGQRDVALLNVQWLDMEANFRPYGDLYLGVYARIGEAVDYAGSRVGDQLQYSPRVTWNANRHLVVNWNHTSVVLDTKAGSNIFTARINDLRATWQFNTRSFLRLTLQHRSVERDGSRDQGLGSQLLFSYKLNPLSVFFLGYADNHLDNDELDGFRLKDRTLFMKVSYAWQR